MAHMFENIKAVNNIDANILLGCNANIIMRATPYKKIYI